MGEILRASVLCHEGVPVFSTKLLPVCFPEPVAPSQGKFGGSGHPPGQAKGLDGASSPPTEGSSFTL